MLMRSIFCFMFISTAVFAQITPPPPKPVYNTHAHHHTIFHLKQVEQQEIVNGKLTGNAWLFGYGDLPHTNDNVERWKISYPDNSMYLYNDSGEIYFFPNSSDTVHFKEWKGENWVESKNLN